MSTYCKDSHLPKDQSLISVIVLDMNILDNGYQIIAWIDRNPAKPSVKTETLEELGFSFIDGKWSYPIIENPQEAKNRFKDLTRKIGF